MSSNHNVRVVLGAKVRVEDIGEHLVDDSFDDSFDFGFDNDEEMVIGTQVSDTLDVHHGLKSISQVKIMGSHFEEVQGMFERYGIEAKPEIWLLVETF